MESKNLHGNFFMLSVHLNDKTKKDSQIIIRLFSYQNLSLCYKFYSIIPLKKHLKELLIMDNPYNNCIIQPLLASERSFLLPTI